MGVTGTAGRVRLMCVLELAVVSTGGDCDCAELGPRFVFDDGRKAKNSNRAPMPSKLSPKRVRKKSMRRVSFFILGRFEPSEPRPGSFCFCGFLLARARHG